MKIEAADYEPRRSTRKRKAPIKTRDEDESDDDGHTLEEVTESDQVVQEKVLQLARLIQNSKNVVVFTGAGISTSAGISDYRGKKGLWTIERKNKLQKITPKKEDKDDKIWFPTPTHMMLKELMSRDMIKYIITQNCDNLHEESGIPPTNLLTLHGNSFTEVCPQCNRVYKRDFIITKPTAPHIYSNMNKKKTEPTTKNLHLTSRTCEECKCTLVDTIVNFGEPVAEGIWNLAEENAKQADLMLVFGSSLKVRPAMDLPTLSKQMIICNLQKTPLDSSADLTIHAPCDTVISKLSEVLNVSIPSYQYNTLVRLCVEIDDKKLKFSLISPRVKAAQLVKERGGTINLNRKNNFLTRVAPMKRNMPVDYTMLLVVDTSHFQKVLSDSASTSVQIPADVLTLKCNSFEISIQLVYDTLSNTWAASVSKAE